MAILTAVTIQPRSAEVWDDLQKQLKKIKQIVMQKGGENTTVLVTMVGGEATNQLVFLTSTENWTKYGQVQDAFYSDPEAQELLQEAGKLATWQTYAAQTIDL
jgi:ABC-type transport system substrate-binding protein